MDLVTGYKSIGLLTQIEKKIQAEEINLGLRIPGSNRGVGKAALRWCYVPLTAANRGDRVWGTG
jgi:hypothetical protein